MTYLVNFRKKVVEIEEKFDYKNCPNYC